MDIRLIALRSVATSLAFVVALSAAPVAAKGIGPGDTRLCDGVGCEPIMDRAAARALASFLYAGPQPERVWRPAPGSPSFEVRLRNGRKLGDVGGRWLNRMRLPRLNCDRFRRRHWYRLPPEIASELRSLAAGRAGIPLDPRAPARSC